MTICEFLGCSFSELPQRCPNLVDEGLIIGYISEKNNREEDYVERKTRSIKR